MLISFEECLNHLSGSDQKITGILHIGAHKGEEISSYAKNGVEYVVWIEANEDLESSLIRNTRQYTSVKQEYISAVISDVEEPVQFNITNNGQSSSILPLGTHTNHYPNITVIERRSVTPVRIDTLVAKNKFDINQIQFVNIDIQGAELAALKSFGNHLHNSSIKMIYCEVNLEQLYQTSPLMLEIDEYLANFGFKRVQESFVPQNWGDALYLREITT